MKKVIKWILIGFGVLTVLGVIFGGSGDTPKTEEVIQETQQEVIQEPIQEVERENEKEVQPTLEPTLTPKPTPTEKESKKIENSPSSYLVPTQFKENINKYVCDCLKNCSQIIDCKEAYFQLNDCGCAKRDNDNDGIPCEIICL